MIEILNKEQILELIDEEFDEPIKSMLLKKLEEKKEEAKLPSDNE